jgi:pseudouridine-5'-phosphate glycosidase
MPYPDNVHTALDVEKIISNEGVVPATVGVLHGELVVGLEPEEIHCLGKLGRNARKLAKRDLAVATTQRLSGGTTVSGTMTAAYQSGNMISLKSL